MKQLGIFGDEYDPTPRRIDNTAADRVAKSVALRAEIGPLPAVVDPARKASARNSVVEFGCIYCMQDDEQNGFLLREPSRKLRDYADDLQAGIEGAGFDHIRIPRGSGKTAWAKIAVLWAVAYGVLKAPVLLAATQEMALGFLTEFWDFWEMAVAFGEDFPEICHPVRMLDGKHQRMASQTLDGKRTRIEKKGNYIILPRVENSKSSRCIIRVGSWGSAIRGRVRGARRPDFAMIDDIQTREDAMSPTTTAKQIAWIQGDVLGLAGADRQLSAVMTSTPIRAGDLSENYADTKQFPGVRTVSHRLVERWPDREDLWEEYGEIWREEMQEGNSMIPRATAFYRANRAAMDAGAEVLDEGAYDRRFEISAIQRAYNLRLRLGGSAFLSEYQLEPPTLATVVSLAPEQVSAKVNHCERMVLPRGTIVPVTFLDVMGEAGIFWTVVACGRNDVGAVIDYGAWPGRNERLVPKGVPQREVERRVVEGAKRVIDMLLAREYHREGGGTARTHAIWIDEGWQARVLRTLMSQYRAKGHTNLLTCKGWDSVAFKGGHGKNVIAKGWQVGLREIEGVRFAGQNSDYWKEVCQMAWLGDPLQPGTLSLWGDNPAVHNDFAAQIAAEKLADKGETANGLTMYHWTQKPGQANHWLDTTAGALAVAGWYRFWGSEVVEATQDDETVVEAHRATVAHSARRQKPRYRSARKR